MNVIYVTNPLWWRCANEPVIYEDSDYACSGVEDSYSDEDLCIFKHPSHKKEYDLTTPEHDLQCIYEETKREFDDMLKDFDGQIEEVIRQLLHIKSLIED